MSDAKLTHRTQLFLTDEQYRWLKVKAGDAGSIAAVVRDWIDSEIEPGPDLRDDPFIKYLLDGPRGSEDPDARSKVNDVDWDVYGDPEFNR